MSSVSDGPLRQWTPQDYPMLETWWNGHGWPAVPQRVLPPLGVIYNDCAAGWLYMDNGGTGVAMMEWLVTNPDAPLLISARSLTKVVEFLKAEAARMEYPIILTTCRQEGLARLLNRAGFATTDHEMIHLLGVF
jgi:hypothetical protein